MSGSSGARIEIEPAALVEMAAKLDAVKQDLADAKFVFDEMSGALQSSTVEGALQHFNGAWSQKRGTLVQQLQDGAGALRAAADAFTEADQQLSAAFIQDAPHAQGSASP